MKVFVAKGGIDLPQGMIGGTCGFIGWERLAAELKISGEVRPSETVTEIMVDKRGLTFRTEKIK